jgi:hypothetical protein
MFAYPHFVHRRAVSLAAERALLPQDELLQAQLVRRVSTKCLGAVTFRFRPERSVAELPISVDACN